jgi:DNA-binding NarL/FixJ family response regulator
MSTCPRPVVIDEQRFDQFRVTPRQAQILDRICQGKTDKAIAAELGLSKATVRSHLDRFYKTNRVHNRSEAATVWSLMSVRLERANSERRASGS